MYNSVCMDVSLIPTKQPGGGGGGEANMILTSVTSSHCSLAVPAEMVIHILVAMVMST